MANAKKQTLEEGLNKSATKKGLTGKERKRYIGGTLENMNKRGEIKIKRSPPPKKGSGKPVKPKEKIELIVKKNATESKSRGYDVYSIYNKKDGKQYNGSTFRKRSVASRNAIDEMHAYNEGLVQKRIKA